MKQRFILVPRRHGSMDSKRSYVAASASADRLVWKDCFSYIEKLNPRILAATTIGAIPPKNEIATLILSEEDRRSGLFIDSAFEKQRNCWSATQGEHHQACYADFYYGDVYLVEENYANFHVRAVRTA